MGGHVGRQAIGQEEGLRFAAREPMAQGGVGQPYLGAAVEGAKEGSHRHGEAPAVESKSELRREAASEKETALDPGLLSAKELRDGRGGELIFVHQGSHDSGLVHRCESPPRSVGGEDPGLHGDAGDGLDDDGDLASALAPPDDHAFEAVEDLEAPIRSPSDAKGHGGQVALWIGVFAAKRGQGGAQLFDGDKEDEAHGFRVSRGRT